MEESLFEFDTSLAQVVIGVRRSGKSTLCLKALLDRKIRFAYANLDDDRLAYMNVGELNTLLSCLYQLYGTDFQYIFLDEVQNVDGWHFFVNRLLRMGLHVFVTGSNAKLLSSEFASHLTGRYNEIRLYPFSFSEYCVYNGIDFSSNTTKAEADRKRALIDYLEIGGFPELQRIQNRRAYVNSLIEAVVLKDIQQRYKIRNANALMDIVNLLIDNNCQPVNVNAVSDLLGLEVKTIRKYLSYLRQAFIFAFLPRHSFKSSMRLRNPKAYIVDIGMISNRASSLSADNFGWRLENVVYIELMRRAARDFLDIYYYKPSSRTKEVDFVVCDRNRPVHLVQVAYDITSPKTFNRETSALLLASSVLQCDNLTLIAQTKSRDETFNGKTIHIRSALDWLMGMQ